MGEACPVEFMGDVEIRPPELVPTPAQQSQAMMGKVRCVEPEPQVKPVPTKR